METILIIYTPKREETLKQIGQPYEVTGEYLAVETKYERELFIEYLDSL